MRNCTLGEGGTVPPPENTKDMLKAIRHKALDLLARREHSRVELQRKLLQRYNDYVLVEQVLDRLASENLQSDQRFSESYVRHRSQGGYGPVRLRQELRERGVSDLMLNESIQANSEHWFAVARQVKCKKFGEALVVDLKQKARQARFLQYRGFSSAHIKSALHVNSTEGSAEHLEREKPNAVISAECEELA